jgi:hypothetical protein
MRKAGATVRDSFCRAFRSRVYSHPRKRPSPVSTPVGSIASVPLQISMDESDLAAVHKGTFYKIPNYTT